MPATNNPYPTPAATAIAARAHKLFPRKVVTGQLQTLATATLDSVIDREDAADLAFAPIPVRWRLAIAKHGLRASASLRVREMPFRVDGTIRVLS